MIKLNEQIAPPKRYYTIDEFIEEFRISRSFFYVRLLNENKIATVKIGNKRLIPSEARSKFIKRLQSNGGLL